MLYVSGHVTMTSSASCRTNIFILRHNPVLRTCSVLQQQLNSRAPPPPPGLTNHLSAWICGGLMMRRHSECRRPISIQHNSTNYKKKASLVNKHRSAKSLDNINQSECSDSRVCAASQPSLPVSLVSVPEAFILKDLQDFLFSSLLAKLRLARSRHGNPVLNRTT